MPAEQQGDDLDLRLAYAMALAIALGELTQEVKMLRFALHRQINTQKQEREEERSWRIVWKR